MKRIVLCLLSFVFAWKAHAATCSQLTRATVSIGTAETKSTITEALVSIGVARDDAETMARASPDVDVARRYALNMLGPRTREVCARELPK